LKSRKKKLGFALSTGLEKNGLEKTQKLMWLGRSPRKLNLLKIPLAFRKLPEALERKSGNIPL